MTNRNPFLQDTTVYTYITTEALQCICMYLCILHRGSQTSQATVSKPKTEVKDTEPTEPTRQGSTRPPQTRSTSNEVSSLV